MDNRNILVAFDGSESAFKAVNYVGVQFSGLADMMITLFYVVPNIPPQFWDDGHILTQQEKRDRQGVIDKWFENQKKVMEPHLEKAGKILRDNFLFEAKQIEGKMRSDVTSVAEALLEEARSGKYRTLILGRRGGIHTLAGGLSMDILHKGAGLAVCIVE
ncbi:MAG: uspA family protein [Deltaproteobacteria bacterium]|nr:uspA family protein [Deltaproteobacteria bacterium]